MARFNLCIHLLLYRLATVSTGMVTYLSANPNKLRVTFSNIVYFTVATSFALSFILSMATLTCKSEMIY